MAEFVMEAAGQSDANNVERRLFVPSRPVIHLAAAAAVLGQAIRKTGSPLYLEHILLRRELIAAIVREAETFERLIEQDPSIPVKDGFPHVAIFRKSASVVCARVNGVPRD